MIPKKELEVQFNAKAQSTQRVYPEKISLRLRVFALGF
jgi:hypothetical protein